MAACLCRQYLKPGFTKTLKTSFQSVKWISDEAHVVMTDDSSTIVCWHPEKFFPYEMSLPIPVKEIPKSDSVLKLQSNKELLSVLKPKHPELVRKELMSLTYTTKHIWFPKKRQFRKKPQIEMDRPYL